MTNWTDPTHVTPNSISSSSKFNAETVDNIKYLHEAKVVRLGHLASLVIPNDSFVIVPWSWEVIDTYQGWAEHQRERLYLPAGYSRVSASFTFPAAPGGIGLIALQIVDWGVDPITVTRANVPLSTTRSVSVHLSAIVEGDGINTFVYLDTYQDSGSTMTTDAFRTHHIELDWIGV